jgi:hypothetical protein
MTKILFKTGIIERYYNETTVSALTNNKNTFVINSLVTGTNEQENVTGKLKLIFD